MRASARTFYTRVITMDSGIYCIYFDSLDDQYYIGCSISVSKRIQEHRAAFVRGNHKNYKLQNAYNKYGMPTIEILELCDIKDLYTKEIEYIKRFDSYVNGFNLTSGGEGGGHGEGNNSALYSEEDYLQVLKLLAHTNMSCASISTELGISIHVVKGISALRTHRYLEQLDPSSYAILKQKSNRDNSAKTKGIVYPNIISPEGLEYSVSNIHKFAEEHGLQYQNLHKVLVGKRLSHKGWKLA